MARVRSSHADGGSRRRIGITLITCSIDTLHIKCSTIAAWGKRSFTTSRSTDKGSDELGFVGDTARVQIPRKLRSKELGGHQKDVNDSPTQHPVT